MLFYTVYVPCSIVFNRSMYNDVVIWNNIVFDFELYSRELLKDVIGRHFVDEGWV